MIYFDGFSSEDLGVFVEYYPQHIIPARKYEKLSVPGRNGDLLFTQDAYENTEREYQIYISAKGRKLNNAIQAVSEWLMKPGYRRLEDSYDPEVYRMAYFVGGLSVENYFNEFGKATIVFDCMPQRWLKSGERTIQVVKNKNITNPTKFPAKPLIKVYGSGSGTLTITGSSTISLSNISEYIVLDSESMNAYKGLYNKNSDMTGTFPELEGTFRFTWTGGITGVDLTPRWVTI